MNMEEVKWMKDDTKFVARSTYEHTDNDLGALQILFARVGKMSWFEEHSIF